MQPTLASLFISSKLCSQKQTLYPPATTANKCLSKGENPKTDILPS